MKKPNQVLELKTKITYLSKLEDNWGTFGESKPNDISIGLANQMADILHAFGFTKYHISVAASGDGGIDFSFHSDSDHQAVIEILNEGETDIILYGKKYGCSTLELNVSSLKILENWLEDPEISLPHALSLKTL